MKLTRMILSGAVLIGAAAITSFRVGVFEVARLNSRIEELEREKTELADFARRLGASRRVAQVDVLAQRTDPAGLTHTALRWQQILAGGALGVPEPVEVTGTQVYFESYVIKFDHEKVGTGDPDRGASLCLFRRAFGDRQTPETGAPLERNTPPAVATSSTEAAQQAKLWARFFDLVDDPRVAAEYGVRVAQIEAPAVPMRPGEIWELSLDAAGGLNLRKIGYRPTTPEQTTAQSRTLPSAERR